MVPGLAPAYAADEAAKDESAQSQISAQAQQTTGDKIDIVTWDSDPARFVCNAIQPAEVSRVIIDAATHTMQLIVNDDRLSLAMPNLRDGANAAG